MSKLSPEAQALVSVGRGALRPTEADRQRVRASLRARISQGSRPSPSGSPSPTAATGLGWPAISGLLIGVALLGGFIWQLRQPTPAPTVAHAATPAFWSPPPLVASPDVAEPVTPPEPFTSSSALAPAPSAPRATSSRSAGGGLADEVALLSRAEIELHASRFASALRWLDEYERKFPRGALTQENVAAKVHALCGLGRIAQAKQQLQRLSPGSLHASRARAACGAGRLD